MLTAANSVAEKTPEPSDDVPEEEKRKHTEELNKILINDVFDKYMPLVEKAVADAKAMNVPNSVAARKQRILEKYENVLDNIKQAIKKVKSNEEAASEKVDGSNSTPSPEAQADKKRRHVASREDEAERAVVECEVNIDGHAWRYTVIGTNATIVGVSSATGSMEVPSAITADGIAYCVTEISDCAFRGNPNIVKITIPASVTEIGSGVFNGCSGLKSIVFEGNVPKIKNLDFFRGFSRCLPCGRFVCKGKSETFPKKDALDWYVAMLLLLAVLAGSSTLFLWWMRKRDDIGLSARK